MAAKERISYGAVPRGSCEDLPSEMMKLGTRSAGLPLLLALLGSSSASEAKPESSAILFRSNKERELWIWGGERQCENQLAICQNATNANKLPYDNWASMLDQLSLEEGSLYEDVGLLVEDLKESNFTNIDEAINLTAGALTTAILDLQLALEGLEEMRSIVEEARKADPLPEIPQEIWTVIDSIDIVVVIENGVKALVDGVSLLFGIDISILNRIVSIGRDIISVIPQGPFGMAAALLSGVVTYLTPFIIQLLGNGQRQLSSDACISELIGCQTLKMSLGIIPTLVGAAFVAEGFKLSAARGDLISP